MKNTSLFLTRDVFVKSDRDDSEGVVGQLVLQLEIAVGSHVPDSDGVVHSAGRNDVGAFANNGFGLGSSV